MKTESKVLFIGGIADGQIRNDPNERLWQVGASFVGGEYDASPTATVAWAANFDVYRRERLMVDREELAFYVMDSLTTLQAIVRLMNGYSSNNHPVD